MRDLESGFYIVAIVLAILRIFDVVAVPWWLIALIGFTPLLIVVLITVCVVVLVNLFRK